jgi:hypothetical protein
VAYVNDILGPPPLIIPVIMRGPGLSDLRKRISACIIARSAGQPCAPGALAKFHP